MVFCHGSLTTLLPYFYMSFVKPFVSYTFSAAILCLFSAANSIYFSAAILHKESLYSKMVYKSNDVFWSHFKRPVLWSFTINVPGFYFRNTPSTVAAIFELGVLHSGWMLRVKYQSLVNIANM